MKIFSLILVLVTIGFSSDLIEETKENFFYSVGMNIEKGTFKNELHNTSGIFEVATLNNSSQSKSGKGLEFSVGRELEEFKIGGFYNQIKWSNASKKTVGLVLKKEFEKLNLGNMNVATLGSFKIGKTDFSLDSIGKKSDTSYSISGGVKHQDMLLWMGYNFIDIDVSKKYAIGGTALHKVNYKGGLFLGVSYEGIFE